MQENLKKYKMTIQAVSPIFIGSGEKIGKKEYIYMPWNQHVIIPDLQKMYAGLEKKKLASEYEAFMMDSRNNQMPISNWLGQNGFKEQDYRRWSKYEMDAGEAFQSKTNRPKEIEAFVKDAYGMPYVPGSSIKGMLRTALMVREILLQTDKYQDAGNRIKEGATRNNHRYLLQETKKLEQETFYHLKRMEGDKKQSNAVNDCMAGILVGDSDPLSLEELTLSQKVDVTLDGKRKPLPLLRETLIPGTKIHFDLVIDTKLSPYSVEDIMDAIDLFQGLSNQYFYDRFGRTITDDYAVFLGGGCGYVSKTVMYALFGDNAVPIIDKVYKMTLGKNYYIHKHGRDIGLNIAPHVCKCTVYRGKLYDMGIGKLTYEEI